MIKVVCDTCKKDIKFTNFKTDICKTCEEVEKNCEININNFGKNLKKKMDDLNMSSIALARESGLTAAAISQLINGLRNPGVSSVLKIMKATGSSFECLFKDQEVN